MIPRHRWWRWLLLLQFFLPMSPPHSSHFGQWILQPWLGYSIVYGRLLKCALSHRPHSNLTNLAEKLLHPWTERVTMTIKYLATTKKKNVVLRSGHHSLRRRQDGPGLCGQIYFRLKCLLIRTTKQRSFWKTLLKPEEFKNAGFAFQCGEKTFWKRRDYDSHNIS